jgi:hypothetical protein
MLITFKSTASANIVMLDTLAYRLLHIIGKSLGERGVLAHEELPAAIAQLEAAIHADNLQQAAQQSRADAPAETPSQDQETNPDDVPVSLAQSAYPLLDMMRRAWKKDAVMTWEA